MEKVKRIYKESFQKYGNSLNAILIPKGRQKERFDSLTQFVDKISKGTLLDYGCGLGHLQGYVANKLPAVTYHGCDIVEEFVAQSKVNFPKSNFFLINNYTDVTASYDYIVAAGVFNLLYSSSKEEHIKIVFDTIKCLFSKTNKVLSVNFMTDRVDYMADGAYHQNPVELYNFVMEKITKRLVIDQSYMPYEYTIYLFKDNEIVKPDNIYKSL